MAKKICISYDAILRWLDFKKVINGTDLNDIEWVRDDGSVIEFNPELIEHWKFMGMTNVCFAELFLSRVVDGEGDKLLEELNTWEKVDPDK